MGTLRVVCLISGGKDSLFSILHCLQSGHEIVALANLHPPLCEGHDVVEDLESYMYQTIGHAVIPLYEIALGLPLYRQSISGSAVNQEKCYGPGDANVEETEDETEALVPLLRKVNACHPDVNAVSTGAILSDYQRTRVESVAKRLGLTPLSYLWQWPALPPHSQTSLLEDMDAVGQDSRIVKVASGGLDDSFLWQNVADLRTVARLDRATKRFGSGDDGAVLGEGGEYETLSVAGPAPLWKARIVVNEDKRNVIAGDAGSASIRILEAHTETTTNANGDSSNLRIPALMEARFRTILDRINRENNLQTTKENEDTDVNTKPAMTIEASNDDNHAELKIRGHVLLSDMTGEGATAAKQMESIMAQATELVLISGHSFRDVAYTSIILRDMGDFASINAVYGAYFLDPNPPARVTIACAGVLPKGKYLTVSMTVVSLTDAASRKGLHVQSRSYWAPANIGPYSQAISVPLEGDEDGEEPALVYVSGQIPLVPASMELPPSNTGTAMKDFALQAVLARQHFERIGRVMHVRQWICAIAFITSTSSEDACLRSKVAREAWEAFYRPPNPDMSGSEDEDSPESFDIWDIKFGNRRTLQHQQHADTNDRLARDEPPQERKPPLHVIQVDVLPRGASIEWVTYGLTRDRESSVEIQHFRHLLHICKDNMI